VVSGKSEDAVTGPDTSLPLTSMADVDAPPADPATEQADMEISADIDEVWTSSRTARQIYSLGLVEKVRALGWTLIHARRRPARRTSAGCSRSRRRPSPCSRSRRRTGRTTTCRRATSAPSSSSSRRLRTSRRSTCAALPLPSALRLKTTPAADPGEPARVARAHPAQPHLAARRDGAPARRGPAHARRRPARARGHGGGRGRAYRARPAGGAGGGRRARRSRDAEFMMRYCTLRFTSTGASSST
jgi:hypothetical protein